MTGKKVTLTNILSFIEGNLQLGLEEFNLQPQHIQEQIAYRRLICKDTCEPTGLCEYCGCDFKGKTSVKKSCNRGKKFPNLMGKVQWDNYKENHGIK